MKKFKGLKPTEQVKKDATNNGWEVDFVDYNKGGDWYWIKDTKNRMLQILVNGFNGHFMVYAPLSDKPIATHMSAELDGKEWYDEILELLYIA